MPKSADSAARPGESIGADRPLDAARVAGLLAGGAAHELNNIFALLLMQVDLLASLVQSAEAEELAGDLRDGVERGITVNRSLLRQAQVAFNDRLPVNPKFVVTGMQKRAEELVGPGASLVTQYPEQLPEVEIEPLGLFAAVLLLCRGARRAAGRDAVTLRLEAPPDEEAPDATVLLEVMARDWSPGEEERGRLEELSASLAAQGVELTLERGKASLRLPLSRPGIET